MAKPIAGVEKTSYFYSIMDSFLEEDNYNLQGSNIGYHGENLTISFLSLNRVELSLKLLNSVEEHLPDFKGEVLIIDNGSSYEQIKKLKKECEKFSFNWRVVELGKNYGVAGGRNKTIDYVITEWVMFLDNDIFFINNPLKQIQEDISILGCHFINIPLLDSDGKRLFAYGGHLYVESSQGNISVGGGTCFTQTDSNLIEQEDRKPFLSNFLFGGASILKKETFLKIGKFDQNMFIGFEDIDLSVRIFREGYKVGNSYVLSLIHDHPKPKENDDDVDYEKKRFSATIIKDSALYLENKYGFKIWNNNLVDWIEEKNKLIGNNIQIERFSEFNPNSKPKVALITDVDYWAFGNISRQIEKNLGEYFDFSLITFEECNWNTAKLLFKTHDCDILHFFWREMIPLVNEDQYKNYFGQMAVSFKDFISDYFENKILSTCVYDHLFLSEDEISGRQELFNKFSYYVSSNKLFDIYNEIDVYKKPLMVIEDGVDPKIFYPINLDRFTDFKKPLTIGWVGNSKWAAESEDFKGFHTILKPAIDELKNQGYEIEGFYSDRIQKFIPHDQMVEYYSQIDILVCTSKIEGTPNPVLEAMACGVPVISTDVGIVPDVLGKKQKEFIIERSGKSLQQAILKIYNQRNMLRELSGENLEMIQPWYWENQCQKFKVYFERLLNR